jgi:hypothetical protein
MCSKAPSNSAAKFQRGPYVFPYILMHIGNYNIMGKGPYPTQNIGPSFSYMSYIANVKKIRQDYVKLCIIPCYLNACK